MKWGLVCELAEGDQSHMWGSDTGQAQHSFTWLILEPWRQPALQILLESWWWNCYSQALQETPEASVIAKENFPIIPQSNLNRFHHPAAEAFSGFWSFFLLWVSDVLGPTKSVWWFNNRSKSLTSEEYLHCIAMFRFSLDLAKFWGSCQADAACWVCHCQAGLIQILTVIYASSRTIPNLCK